MALTLSGSTEATRARSAISEGRDAVVLLRCFAGCDVGAILAAVGLAVRVPVSEARHEGGQRGGETFAVRFVEHLAKRRGGYSIARSPASASVSVKRPATNVPLRAAHLNEARERCRHNIQASGSPHWPVGPGSARRTTLTPHSRR